MGKKDKILFPDRLWFRLLLLFQYLYFLFNFNEPSMLVALTLLVCIYFAISPDVIIFSDGIMLNWFFISKFVKFEDVNKVRITPTQMFINHKALVFPIFAFVWRKNYKTVVSFLNDNLNGKVVFYAFPLP